MKMKLNASPFLAMVFKNKVLGKGYRAKDALFKNKYIQYVI